MKDKDLNLKSMNIFRKDIIQQGKIPFFDLLF